MKLIRLVNAYITTSSRVKIDITLGPVNVKTLVIWNFKNLRNEKKKKICFRIWKFLRKEKERPQKIQNEKRYLIYGIMELTKELDITTEKLIIIPKEEREKIEKAIETAINLFAVSTGSSRSISSPTPYIALQPDNDEERKMLEELNGFVLNPTTIPGAPFQTEFNDELLMMVHNRLDGVSLLAEALSHSHPTGRFHEFLRLFERAFTRSSSRLVQPLTEFLIQADQGFSKKEIENWVVKLRHPATHADRYEEFILESGIRPVVQRMKQAAYEILFNKKEWRNSTSERRKMWYPVSGTLTDKMDVFLTKGEYQSLEYQLLDGFSSYPHDLTGSIGHFLPKNWWYKKMDKFNIRGKVEIKEPKH